MAIIKTIANRKNITFTKVKYSKTNLKKPHKYAVVIDDAGLDKASIFEVYINALINKFYFTPTIEKEDFIEYQESIQADRTTWLNEVFGMLNDYQDSIKLMTMDDTVDVFKSIIKGRLTSRTSPQLKWNKSQTDLIELVIALTADGAVESTTGKNTQVEIIRAFEVFFGIELPNHRRLTQTALNRETTTPFLRELIDAFSHRAEEKNK